MYLHKSFSKQNLDSLRKVNVYQPWGTIQYAALLSIAAGVFFEASR